MARRLKSLKGDRGKKYMSKEFDNFYADEGIDHQLTFGYISEQNGVSEKKKKEQL